MFCALLLSLLVTNKGVIVDSYVPDLAGFTFDSMGRIASGQVPHNDFHSPIGQAFYWPFALIASVSPLRTMTVLYANALVAAVGLGFSALLLRGRLATPLFCLSIWWDVGRTYSPTIFPDGKRLLGDTDWVMEPVIVPGLGGDNRGDTNTPQMMKIYGADIRREFAVVRQTGSWRLWGRKHV